MIKFEIEKVKDTLNIEEFVCQYCSLPGDEDEEQRDWFRVSFSTEQKFMDPDEVIPNELNELAIVVCSCCKDHLKKDLLITKSQITEEIPKIN